MNEFIKIFSQFFSVSSKLFTVVKKDGLAHF